MEQLTVEEVIKYAIRVEQESYQFHRRVSRVLTGSDLKTLIDEFSEKEVCHIRDLKRYIKDDTEVEEALSPLMMVDTTLFDGIIVSDDIPPKATAVDILRIALERELMSRDNYAMLAGLARVGEDIKSTFRSIGESKDAHAKLIRERLERAKGSA